MRVVIITAFFGLVVGLAGCGSGDGGSGGAETPDPCEGIQVKGEGGQTLCVTRLPATETGFTCPPEMFAFGGDGWGACTSGGWEKRRDVLQELIGGDVLSCGEMALDLLFVIDTSASMCDEREPLLDAYTAFADTLAGYGADLQVAVTSMDHQCDPELALAGGRFNTQAAKALPASCQQQVMTACASDADCDAALGDPGQWQCSKAVSATCMENPNGSLNTACRRRCTEDVECQALLGPTAVCQKPSSSPMDWGCLVPNPTDGCAEVTGPVLTETEADQFRCIASPQINQLQCFRDEQGMKTAWSALNPEGPNAAQAQAFVRPEAMLAIVFVTDEDDCSPDEGQALDPDPTEQCWKAKTSDEGGPLVPVAKVAERFRSLKSDPAQVRVLAISGDSLETTAAGVSQDRQAYFDSAAAPLQCHAWGTTICGTGGSDAQLGSRWLSLVEEMGGAGRFHNVCRPDDFEAALDGLLLDVADSWMSLCALN